MGKENITIEAADGFPLAATLFSPSYGSNAVIVFASALGVPRYIYYKLARYLTEKGFSVLTFDYRGVHESQSGLVSGSEIRMADWGRFDIDAALKWALDECQGEEIIYMAHSCGGQLVGLAPNSSRIDKAVFIACQSGYWKLWSIPYRWGVWAVWTLIPLITPWFDDFPARALGLSSVNIPSGVARQWAKWGKSTNYLWDFISEEDIKRYQGLTFPLLSLGFSDDRYFGPPAATEKLLAYYPKARKDLKIVSPSDYKKNSIGHFGFFKEDFKQSLWKDFANWIMEDLQFNNS